MLLFLRRRHSKLSKALRYLLGRNPLALFQLNEPTGPTLRDASGHTTATAIGAPSFNYPAPLASGGAGIYLGDNGSSLGLPVGLCDGATGFTFMAWVKWTGDRHWEWLLTLGSGTSNYLCINTTNYDGSQGLWVSLSTPANGTATLNLPNRLAVGQWQHLAVTLDGSTARVYLDGWKVGEGAFALTPDALGHTTQNMIGQGPFGSLDPYFHGAIADVFIADHRLTQTEIGNIAGLGRALAASGPETYLPLAADATDASGHNHHGVASPEVTFGVASPYGPAVKLNGGHIKLPVTSPIYYQYVTEIHALVKWDGTHGGILFNGGDGQAYDVVSVGDDGAIYMNKHAYWNGRNEGTNSAAGAMPVDQWVLASFIENGAGMNLFINGAFVTGTGTSNIAPDPTNWAIGDVPNGTSSPMPLEVSHVLTYFGWNDPGVQARAYQIVSLLGLA